MLLSLLWLACSAPDEDTGAEEDDSGGGDTAAATDTGGDTDTGGGPGEVYQLGDPGFTVSIEGAPWSSVDGYWVAFDDESTLRAEYVVSSSTVQIVILTLDGDVSQAGTWPVADIDYVEQVYSSGDSFHYQVHEPAGVTFTTRGFAEEEYLFGDLEGTATLTDTVGGGQAEVGPGAVESWPRY